MAGPNGAGKSSLAGDRLRLAGGDYFNADEHTRRYLQQHPNSDADTVNAEVWKQSYELLFSAITQGRDFAFETTLGGTSISDLLLSAALGEHEVRIWFCALASADLHLARVNERVSRGGHAISEERIRARYDYSREHLIELLPHISILQLFDNSGSVNVEMGEQPRPRQLLHWENSRIQWMIAAEKMPQWAKPIAAVAWRLHDQASRPSFAPVSA